MGKLARVGTDAIKYVHHVIQCSVIINERNGKQY